MIKLQMTLEKKILGILDQNYLVSTQNLVRRQKKKILMKILDILDQNCLVNNWNLKKTPDLS